MTPFTTLTSVALPLLEDRIDTDILFPARYLLLMQRDGLGEYFCRDRRIDAQGVPIPGNPVDDPRNAGARIVLAGEDFGCGSSREHAAWALNDMGVKVVIAPSFSDIFSGNAFKNGILTVALPQAAIDKLMEVAKTDPIHIDLEAQSVTTPFQDRFSFNIDPFRKMCLLNGLDEISLTEKSEAAIAEHEQKIAKTQPWLTPTLA